MKLFEQIDIHLTYNELREIIAKLLERVQTAENIEKNIVFCKKLIAEKAIFMNKQELSELYYLHAKDHYGIHELGEAKKACLKGIEILDSNPADEFANTKVAFLYSIFYNMMGSIESESGNIFESIRYYHIAYEKSIFCEDVHMGNILLANICEILTNLNMYEKALEVLNVSKKFVLENLDDSKPFLRIALGNISLNQSICYAELGDLKRAKDLFKEIPMYIDPRKQTAFMYEYYNLQSLLYQKEKKYEKADALFDEVYSYFIRNKNVDNSSKVLSIYLNEYLKRDLIDEDRFFNLIEMAERNAKKLGNLYFNAMLKKTNMTYIAKKRDVKLFKRDFKSYSDSLNAVYHAHLKEYSSSLIEQYESLSKEERKKEVENKIHEYKKLRESIRQEQEVYRKTNLSFRFINNFSNLTKHSSEFEKSLRYSNKLLKNKIRYELFAVAIIRENDREIEFLIVDEDHNLHRMSTYKEDINKQTMKKVEQCTLTPVFVQAKEDSFISNEFKIRLDNLLVSKLIHKEDYFAIAFLLSTDKREYNSEDIAIFETAAPYLSIAVQRYIIKSKREAAKKEKILFSKKLEDCHKKLNLAQKLDGLTMVPNKMDFNTKSLVLYRKSINLNRKISCVLVDIDNFKMYNDYYGYRKADESIKRIAKSLYMSVINSQCFDKDELIFARIYKDVFALLFIDNERTELEHISKMLIKIIAELRIENCQSELNVISVGIGASTFLPKEEVLLYDFFDYTEKLLRIAKMKGENSYVIKEYLPGE